MAPPEDRGTAEDDQKFQRSKQLLAEAKDGEVAHLLQRIATLLQQHDQIMRSKEEAGMEPPTAVIQLLRGRQTRDRSRRYNSKNP